MYEYVSEKEKVKKINLNLILILLLRMNCLRVSSDSQSGTTPKPIVFICVPI